ncbi:MAG: MBL fold metallo-hydrolase [Planctomycetota bacterium]|nr:MAG: MBL fold metallo-hydrolase [Planctomycetota bacterium]
MSVSQETTVLPEVCRFDAAGGARIYRVSCDAFPGFVVHCYLILNYGPPTLVDVGSGFGDANDQLLAGLEKVRTEFGETVGLADIERIIITHGHIDHFGGLSFLHEKMPQAEIAIHQLDARILTAFEERVEVAKKAIRRFLQQSGVSDDMLQGFMDVYGYSKKNMHSLPVARTLVDNQKLDGLRFIHTPGHCPGQVCIMVGDVLLSADHILPLITPHQAPESIMPYTGLGHYLESLGKVARVEGIRMALGGHQKPVENVYQRIVEIRESHERKLEKVWGVVEKSPEPLTMNDISSQLYVHVKGFHVLLALEEVAAHVEYLYQHNRLAIANLDEYRREENPAIRYVVA